MGDGIREVIYCFYLLYLLTSSLACYVPLHIHVTDLASRLAKPHRRERGVVAQICFPLGAVDPRSAADNRSGSPQKRTNRHF
jgi:hypothetical protein